MSSSEFKVLVIVAGVPEEIANAFSRRVNQLNEGRRKIIFSPMPFHSLYTEKYVSDLYALFVETVDKFIPLYRINENTPIWFEGVITIFLEYEENKADTLIEVFGVETFIASVKSPRLSPIRGMKPNSIRSACNSLIREIRKSIRSGEKTLLAIRRQVTSNANKTPFLLPFRNFGRSEMKLLRDHIIASTGAPDPQEKILSIAKKFENDARRIKYGSDPYSSFSNANNIVFRRPSACHGVSAASSNDHDSSCYIRSRLRFGACINPRFHYDCVKRRGKLPTGWNSCHGQHYNLPRGRTHVNIAPNDHIR